MNGVQPKHKFEVQSDQVMMIKELVHSTVRIDSLFRVNYEDSWSVRTTSKQGLFKMNNGSVASHKKYRCCCLNAERLKDLQQDGYSGLHKNRQRSWLYQKTERGQTPTANDTQFQRTPYQIEHIIECLGKRNKINWKVVWTFWIEPWSSN